MVTNNTSLANKIRVLRDHGQEKKYDHSHIGWNGRMDGIQGAVLRVKLKYLAKGNVARQAHATLYGGSLINGDGLRLPEKADYGTHVYHVYAVRAKSRDRLLRSLEGQNIFAQSLPYSGSSSKSLFSFGTGARIFPGGRAVCCGVSFVADVS